MKYLKTMLLRKTFEKVFLRILSKLYNATRDFARSAVGQPASYSGLSCLPMIHILIRPLLKLLGKYENLFLEKGFHDSSFSFEL